MGGFSLIPQIWKKPFRLGITPLFHKIYPQRCPCPNRIPIPYIWGKTERIPCLRSISAGALYSSTSSTSPTKTTIFIYYFMNKDNDSLFSTYPYWVFLLGQRYSSLILVRRAFFLYNLSRV